MQRSTKFDLYCENREQHRLVLNAIRQYRAICRKVYCACAASSWARSSPPLSRKSDDSAAIKRMGVHR